MTWLKRLILWPILILLAVTILFFLSAWIGSSISRNSDWVEPERGVDIFIESNGVHTAIVMPLITAQKDWREDFPVDEISNPHRDYTHVSVSWGEREVFLNTPQWSDLTLAVAVNAAIGGEGLLHISHYMHPAPSDFLRPLRISNQEYARLIAAIERDIPPVETRKSYPGYGDYDVFYDAAGNYHLANTCNQWTSDRLAESGIRTGYWTPLASGVTKWAPRTGD